MSDPEDRWEDTPFTAKGFEDLAAAAARQGKVELAADIAEKAEDER